MKALVALAAFPLLLALSGSPVAAHPSCEPACNDATTRVANRIDGKGHVGWLATTLDINGYEGKRWAEITRIPPGHGKRNIGIIQVPKANTAQARKALKGSWLARKGNLFVLPLVTKYATDGGTGSNFQTAAEWAASKLGTGWKVVAP